MSGQQPEKGNEGVFKNHALLWDKDDRMKPRVIPNTQINNLKRWTSLITNTTETEEATMCQYVSAKILPCPSVNKPLLSWTYSNRKFSLVTKCNKKNRLDNFGNCRSSSLKETELTLSLHFLCENCSLLV